MQNIPDNMTVFSHTAEDKDALRRMVLRGVVTAVAYECVADGVFVLLAQFFHLSV